MAVDASTIKSTVIAVINLYPNGLPADELNDEYRKLEGCEIPFRSCGYPSLLRFVEDALKDRVRIEKQVETNDFFLFPIANEKSGHIIDLIKGQIADKNTRHRQFRMVTSKNKNADDEGAQSSDQQLPDGVHYLQSNNPNWALQMTKARENQLKIIKNFTLYGHNELSLEDDGIDNENIPVLQSRKSKNQTNRKQKMHSGPFNMQGSPKNGSAEARDEYISSLKKKYQNRNSSDRRGAQRYYKQNNRRLSGSNQPNDHNQFNSVEDEYKWEDIMVDIDDLALSVVDELRNIDKYSPSDELPETYEDDDRDASCASAIINHVDKIEFTLTKNDAIELQYVWKDLSVGDEIECTLEEINNPLKFWLRLKKDKDKFKTLSELMNKFYNRHDTELKLWDNDLDEHELFACRYGNKWYRVRVEDTLEDSKVRVRFVDFGSREDVPVKKLRRLPSEFMKVPILAVCSALGNVQPVGQNFTAESAECIIRLTDNKDLIAKVLRINQPKQKIMVELKIKDTLLDVSFVLVQDDHATIRLPQ